MDFSSLVLMEFDKQSNVFVKELGSYEITEGAKYITKMYYDGEKVNLFFSTNRDVEEWEYTGIYDNFDMDKFDESQLNILEIDDEYNPTWQIKFDFIEDHKQMQDKLKMICDLIKLEIEKTFLIVKDKKNKYI